MSFRVKPYISLWDKSFKESHTRNYILTMQMNLHGLSFSVFNPDKNKHIGFEAYTFTDLKDVAEIPGKFDLILNRHEWFAYSFKKVILLYQNSLTTLVPAPLFDEKHKSLFLGFNQPFAENHRIIYNTIKNLDIVNVFYIPNPVAEKVLDFWPNARLGHFSSALIDCLALNFKNKLEKEVLFLQVNDGDFNLVSFSGNKLVYHNVFKYNTKEDFIYFLLAAVEQLGYNPENIELILLGKIEKGQEIYMMLEQYIGTFRFIEKNENIGYSYVFDEMRPHNFYVLLNALQCG
jgi:hypothetical protein